LRPPTVLVPPAAQAGTGIRPLTGGDSMPILRLHPQRKEVIQCLTPSAVTSLGSPAKLSWAWQTGRSQRLDQRVQQPGRDGSHPVASFFLDRGMAINHPLSQHLSSAVACTMRRSRPRSSSHFPMHHSPQDCGTHCFAPRVATAAIQTGRSILQT